MGSFLEYVGRTSQKLFTPTRQNHALEHGTVSVLLRRSEQPMHVMGRATPDGFYIRADVSEKEVESAAREALERLQKGEEHLAVSPFCGTNLAVAGVLAAVACYFALGSKNRASRLPWAIFVATVAVIVAQPLGALLQGHVTTSSDVGDMRIRGVRRIGSPSRPTYRVETARTGAYETAVSGRRAS